MDWATRCGEYTTKITGILGGEHCVSFLGVVCRTNESLPLIQLRIALTDS